MAPSKNSSSPTIPHVNLTSSCSLVQCPPYLTSYGMRHNIGSLQNAPASGRNSQFGHFQPQEAMLHPLVRHPSYNRMQAPSQPTSYAQVRTGLTQARVPGPANMRLSVQNYRQPKGQSRHQPPHPPAPCPPRQAPPPYSSNPQSSITLNALLETSKTYQQRTTVPHGQQQLYIRNQVQTQSQDSLAWRVEQHGQNQPVLQQQTQPIQIQQQLNQRYPQDLRKGYQQPIEDNIDMLVRNYDAMKKNLTSIDIAIDRVVQDSSKDERSRSQVITRDNDNNVTPVLVSQNNGVSINSNLLRRASSDTVSRQSPPDVLEKSNVCTQITKSTNLILNETVSNSNISEESTSRVEGISVDLNLESSTSVQVNAESDPSGGQNILVPEWIDDLDLAARIYVAYKLLPTFEECEEKFLESLKNRKTRVPSRTFSTLNGPATSLDVSSEVSKDTSLPLTESTEIIDLTEEVLKKPSITPRPIHTLLENPELADVPEQLVHTLPPPEPTCHENGANVTFSESQVESLCDKTSSPQTNEMNLLVSPDSNKENNASEIDITPFISANEKTWTDSNREQTLTLHSDKGVLHIKAPASTTVCDVSVLCNQNTNQSCNPDENIANNTNKPANIINEEAAKKRISLSLKTKSRNTSDGKKKDNVNKSFNYDKYGYLFDSKLKEKNKNKDKSKINSIKSKREKMKKTAKQKTDKPTEGVSSINEPLEKIIIRKEVSDSHRETGDDKKLTYESNIRNSSENESGQKYFIVNSPKCSADSELREARSPPISKNKTSIKSADNNKSLGTTSCINQVSDIKFQKNVVQSQKSKPDSFPQCVTTIHPAGTALSFETSKEMEKVPSPPGRQLKEIDMFQSTKSPVSENRTFKRSNSFWRKRYNIDRKCYVKLKKASVSKMRLYKVPEDVIAEWLNAKNIKTKNTENNSDYDLIEKFSPISIKSDYTQIKEKINEPIKRKASVTENLTDFVSRNKESKSDHEKVCPTANVKKSSPFHKSNFYLKNESSKSSISLKRRNSSDSAKHSSKKKKDSDTCVSSVSSIKNNPTNSVVDKHYSIETKQKENKHQVISVNTNDFTEHLGSSESYCRTNSSIGRIESIRSFATNATVYYTDVQINSFPEPLKLSQITSQITDNLAIAQSSVVADDKTDSLNERKAQKRGFALNFYTEHSMSNSTNENKSNASTKPKTPTKIPFEEAVRRRKSMDTENSIMSPPISLENQASSELNIGKEHPNISNSHVTKGNMNNNGNASCDPRFQKPIYCGYDTSNLANFSKRSAKAITEKRRSSHDNLVRFINETIDLKIPKFELYYCVANECKESYDNIQCWSSHVRGHDT